MTHPVHTLGDERFVAEAFEEGKWLVYGVGDLQLLVHEVLEKSLFQGPCCSEHPVDGASEEKRSKDFEELGKLLSVFNGHLTPGILVPKASLNSLQSNLCLKHSRG